MYVIEFINKIGDICDTSMWFNLINRRGGIIWEYIHAWFNVDSNVDFKIKALLKRNKNYKSIKTNKIR